MKQHSSDVDSIPRWRDRPAGWRVGRGPRRGAGARRRSRPTHSPSGSTIDSLSGHRRRRLKTERRARPPFWLRPALVAALLTVSVASVLGYEAGWFAPLRERLRFRSIPPVAPEPVEHAKRRATQSQTSPADDQRPPARTSRQPTSRPPRAPAGSGPLPRARRRRSARARRSAKLAVADNRPRRHRRAGGRARRTNGRPRRRCSRSNSAMGLLRGTHDAPAALAALDDYFARFPRRRARARGPRRARRRPAHARSRGRGVARARGSCRSTRTAARRSCS